MVRMQQVIVEGLAARRAAHLLLILHRDHPPVAHRLHQGLAPPGVHEGLFLTPT
eukprot:m.95425 g.95425  ORF g.95425 m.95425 type:complete len:54 (-) comp14765_c0_seq1:846-1007(-)